MGTMSTTESGRQCQAWASNTPHEVWHTVTDDKFPDGSRAAARNYCRTNVVPNRGPWCYTMDPRKRWEKCRVPHCSESFGKYIVRENVMPRLY